MNLLFEKTKHVRHSEFQAVILAGYGSSNRYIILAKAWGMRKGFVINTTLHWLDLLRLYPISEDDNLPKALLPVGNRPMIAYTLDWLEKAGIYGNISQNKEQGCVQ
jgi:translation initiation factor eIF-2B subunit gamma